MRHWWLKGDRWSKPTPPILLSGIRSWIARIHTVVFGAAPTSRTSRSYGTQVVLQVYAGAGAQVAAEASAAGQRTP